VGGVRATFESIPIDGISGTVLGVWFVDPFDFLSVDAAGLPVRFVDEWSLPVGTELDVYVGSYGDSAWLSAGTATVGMPDGGGVVSIEGAALPLIGSVLLVQP
jgi:hypothetical protein